MTKQFGPMFKMIGVMVLDLVQFLTLWITVLVVNSSVSNLIFGNMPIYNDFLSNLLFHFESALGSWDMRATCQDSQKAAILELSEEEQAKAALVCNIGRGYTVFILLVHSVLFLNFVIAILS